MICDKPSVKKQIIYLMGVLGAGLAAALALIGYLLYTYGPTGQYKAANVLLDPAVARNLAFSDTDFGRGKNNVFELDAIKFQYFEESSKQWRVDTLADWQYDDIYELLKGDESVPFPSQEMTEQFSLTQPSTLEFIVRQKLNPNASGESKVFISAEFIPKTDEYRVKLRASEGWQQYAYFVHPGVYQKLMAIIRKVGH